MFAIGRKLRGYAHLTMAGQAFHLSPTVAATSMSSPGIVLDRNTVEKWLECDTTTDILHALIRHRRRNRPGGRKHEPGDQEQCYDALYHKHLGKRRYQLCRLDKPGTFAASVLFDWLSSPSVVHSVSTLEDVQRRTYPTNQRVYGLFHDTSFPDDDPNNNNPSTGPFVVLKVSLQPSVPSTLEQVLTPLAAYSDHTLRVATFYSISLLEVGLAGLGLGELTLHRAMDDLTNNRDAEEETLDDLDTFVTLSPLDKSFPPCPQAAAEALAENPDAVAKFHLGNGAQLFRVNPPDPAFEGTCNVNYLYELSHMAERRQAFRDSGIVSLSEHISVPSTPQ